MISDRADIAKTLLRQLHAGGLMPRFAAASKSLAHQSFHIRNYCLRRGQGAIETAERIAHRQESS
jgi:hypothetical protein